MAIYIKGMDMPKSCIECPLHGESACKAFTTIEPWTFKDDERAAFCPLTEVPEPHGRLIDLDALIDQISIDSAGNRGQYGDEWLFEDTIEKAPTIIERSE